MRTETRTLYKFLELSDEAQAYAIEHYPAEWLADDLEHRYRDIYDTVKYPADMRSTVENIFAQESTQLSPYAIESIDLHSLLSDRLYRVSSHGVEFAYTDDEWLAECMAHSNLSDRGQRWIEKLFSAGRVYINRDDAWATDSTVTRARLQARLDQLTHTMHELKEEAVTDLRHGFTRMFESEEEYVYSEEHIRDMFENNDYEFTEDGDLVL